MPSASCCTSFGFVPCTIFQYLEVNDRHLHPLHTYFITHITILKDVSKQKSLFVRQYKPKGYVSYDFSTGIVLILVKK